MLSLEQTVPPGRFFLHVSVFQHIFLVNQLHGFQSTVLCHNHSDKRLCDLYAA